MKIKIQPGLDHITDRADLLQDFVVFVCKDLQCMPCPIDIVNGREDTGLKTTAQYDTQNHHVMVNAKNRHFGDVLRSIAHELVHHKQNLKGELNAPVQDVGGDIEDEANARAGALLKSFAYQEGPERIYEQARPGVSSATKELDALLSTFLRAAPLPDSPGTPGGEAGSEEQEEAKPAKKVDPSTLPPPFSNKELDIMNPNFLVSLGGNPIDLRDPNATSPVANTPQTGMLSSYGMPTRKSRQFQGGGSPIYCVLPGIISAIGHGSGKTKRRGNYVQVAHAVNADEVVGVFLSTYMNLERLSGSDIAVGKKVFRGEVLGFAFPAVGPYSDDNDHTNDYTEFTFKFLGLVRKKDMATAPINKFIDLNTLLRGGIKGIFNRVKDKYAEALSAEEDAASAKKEVTQVADEFLLEQAQLNTLEAKKRKFINDYITMSTPVQGKNPERDISSGYGMRTHPVTGKRSKHTGIDIKVGGIQNVVDAVAPCPVIITATVDGRSYISPKRCRKMSRAGRLTPGDRAGNLIKMEPFFKALNGEKIIIRFLHLHRGSIAVSRGNSANTGTPIAKVGRSGCVTGVHLHVDMRKGREYYETWSSLVDDVKAVKSAFVKVFDDDEKFLELFKRLVPEEYRGTYKAPTSEHKVIKDYITEMITAYGLGRVDPTKGGVGKMFKLGVDYELAGTNIPHVGQGYVDRVHSLPYEIIVKTDQDPRATYKTMFGKDMLTNFVHIVPDQVYYGKDGFKLSAHVSTGSNQGDEEDVELITNELYKFITSLPSTPDPSTFFITVYPVVDKIKYFV